MEWLKDRANLNLSQLIPLANKCGMICDAYGENAWALYLGDLAWFVGKDPVACWQKFIHMLYMGPCLDLLLTRLEQLGVEYGVGCAFEDGRVERTVTLYLANGENISATGIDKPLLEVVAQACCIFIGTENVEFGSDWITDAY